MILALLGFPEGHAGEWRLGIDTLFHHEPGETGFKASAEGLPADLATDGSLGTCCSRCCPRSWRNGAAIPTDDLISALVNSEIEDDDGTTPAGHRPRVPDVHPDARHRRDRDGGAPAELDRGLLARNPDERALSPQTRPGRNAIEELLRYEAPSPVNARWVTRDVGSTARDPGGFEAHPAQRRGQPRRATFRRPRPFRRAAQHRPSPVVRLRRALLHRRGAGAARVADRAAGDTRPLPRPGTSSTTSSSGCTPAPCAASPTFRSTFRSRGAALTTPLLDDSLSLVMPAGRGPHPALVLGAEAYGPNPFHPWRASAPGRPRVRVGRTGLLPRPRSDEPPEYDQFDEVIEHIARLDFTRAARQLARAVDALRASPEIDPRARLAVWGYCTGRTLAWLAACSAATWPPRCCSSRANRCSTSSVRPRRSTPSTCSGCSPARRCSSTARTTS